MPKFQNTHNSLNVITGLDLKRLIDAYNLWDIPMLKGTDAVFDINEDFVLVIHADKEEGVPCAFVFPKNPEESEDVKINFEWDLEKTEEDL